MASIHDDELGNQSHDYLAGRAPAKPDQAPLRNRAATHAALALNALVGKLCNGEPVPPNEIARIYEEAREKRHFGTLMVATNAVALVTSVKLEVTSPELMSEIQAACTCFGNCALRLFGTTNLEFSADLFVNLLSERLGYLGSDNFEVCQMAASFLRDHPYFDEPNAIQDKKDVIIRGISKTYVALG